MSTWLTGPVPDQAFRANGADPVEQGSWRGVLPRVPAALPGRNVGDDAVDPDRFAEVDDLDGEPAAADEQRVAVVEVATPRRGRPRSYRLDPSPGTRTRILPMPGPVAARITNLTRFPVRCGILSVAPWMRDSTKVLR